MQIFKFQNSKAVVQFIITSNSAIVFNPQNPQNFVMQAQQEDEMTSTIVTISQNLRYNSNMDTQQIEPSQEILELLSEIYKMKKNTTKLTTELKKKIAKHFFDNGCHDIQEFNKRIEPYAACFVKMTIESDKEQLPDHLKIKYKDKLDIYDKYMALKSAKQASQKRLYSNDFDGK